MRYEYDCWKCGDWHLLSIEQTPNTEEELQRIAENTGAAIRNAETKVIVIGGHNG